MGRYKEEISGTRYANLVIISFAGIFEDSALWNCKCDCGRETVIQGNLLRAGRIKSCGCKYLALHKRGAAVSVSIGDKYGKLIVQGRLPTMHGSARWKCLCECGKSTEVISKRLRNGRTKSCGCLRGQNIKLRNTLSPEELERRRTQPRPCKHCGVIRPPEEFNGLKTRTCTTCERYKNVKKSYGLEKSEYDFLLKSQNGKCAICQKLSKKTWHVDHDHETGFVRGFLCNPCNYMIGHAYEDPFILWSAIRYLQRSALAQREKLKAA